MAQTGAAAIFLLLRPLFFFQRAENYLFWGWQRLLCAAMVISVSLEKAAAIAQAMGKKLEEVFRVEKNTEPLSDKTILEHHRLISTAKQAAFTAEFGLTTHSRPL